MPTRAERRAARAARKEAKAKGSTPPAVSHEHTAAQVASESALPPDGGTLVVKPPFHKPGVDVISLVAAAISKVHGNVVHRLSDHGAYPEVSRWVSTGIPALDAAMGGGLPLGRFVEVSGPESCGKSTLCKWIAAQCQKQGVYPLLLDTEHSGMLEYDTGLGLDPHEALGGQPETMEEVFAVQDTAINKFRDLKVDCLIIWDSVVATLTQEEIDTAYDEEGRRGAKARCLAKNIPKMMTLLKGTTNVGLLYVNQVRANMDANNPYAPKTKTPGGYALRHFAHIRAELRPRGQLKKGDTVEGIRSLIKIVKNKVAPPYKEADLEFYHTPPRVQEAGAREEARPKRTPFRIPVPVPGPITE